MSWRTQGHYRALSAADREWLERFDRDWDTKAEGRSRTDAYEKLRRLCVTDYAFEEIDTNGLSLADALSWISRFSQPRRRESRWGIYLHLADGRHIRVSFKDKETANQLHAVLLELFHSEDLNHQSIKNGQE